MKILICFAALLLSAGPSPGQWGSGSCPPVGGPHQMFLRSRPTTFPLQFDAKPADVMHGWYAGVYGQLDLYWHGERVGTLDPLSGDWRTAGKEITVNLLKEFGLVTGKSTDCKCKDCCCKWCICFGDVCRCKECCGKTVGKPIGDLSTKPSKECVCPKDSCCCSKCPGDCVAAYPAVQAMLTSLMGAEGPVFQQPFEADPFPGGVDKEKVLEAPFYEKKGRSISKEKAYEALVSASLTDDRTKQFLTIVGDDALRKAVLSDLATSPALAAYRDKLHVNAYPLDHWCVAQIGLSPGVSLQGPPDSKGESPVLFRFRSYESANDLAEAIRKADPNYKPDADPDPKKKPDPPPAPKTPDTPAPKGPDLTPTGPQPNVIPMPTLLPWLLLGLGGFVALIIYANKK